MKHLLTSACLCVLLLTACHGGRTQNADDTADSTKADTTVAEQVADSTLYGTSDEFGMSTFTLITDQGDTLYVARTANDGTDGQVYGDLKEDERYALTTRDNGEAIGVLINLTQLDKHTQNYDIRNGQLYVDGQPKQIETLNDRELKFK